jgi:hypothetical protein
MKTKMMLGMVCVALAACGGENENTATTSAAIVGSLDGTYDFVLDASDVAPKLRAKCGADKACWEEIEKDAQTEKIRFSKNAAGELVFTSFSIEGSKEEVFLEAPVALTELSPGVYRGKLVGWPKGTLVAKLTRNNSEMKVERRADGTLTVFDEKKGRLVYKRAS